MISQDTLDKWDMKIGVCIEIESLTLWEAEFIDSISIQREKEKELSMKQSQILTAIYNRVSG